MEVMQKEWNSYIKEILLNELYDRNIDEKVIYFLKNYNLSEVNVMNEESNGFELEIIFCQKDETMRIFGQYESMECCFFWAVPEKFNFTELEDIIDRFEFKKYIEIRLK